jgi:hypothetical protein
MPRKNAKKAAAKNAKAKAPAAFGSKTKFILSFPGETPAKEIVEKAKAEGVEFSEKYVYVVRSNAKMAAQRQAGRAGMAVSGRSRAATSGLEAELRKVIAEMGLARARQVFSEVESAFGGQ